MWKVWRWHSLPGWNHSSQWPMSLDSSRIHRQCTLAPQSQCQPLKQVNKCNNEIHMYVHIGQQHHEYYELAKLQLHISMHIYCVMYHLPEESITKTVALLSLITRLVPITAVVSVRANCSISSTSMSFITQIFSQTWLGELSNTMARLSTGV